MSPAFFVMSYTILPFTYFISLVFCTAAFPISFATGAIDTPDGVRKLGKARPRLIGLGFILAFFVISLLFFWKSYYPIPLFISAAVLMIGTLLDDTVTLKPMAKLFFQSLAALTLILLFGVPSGISIFSFYLPLPLPISLAVTLLFGLVLINAANIIDGLDTLLLTLMLISLVFITVLAFSSGNSELLFLTLALFFSLLGFLPFNLPKAKGFMGDTGAQFLGLYIFFALLSLSGRETANTGQSLEVYFDLSLLLIFFLPPLEVGISFIRRIKNGKSPFSADTGHLHYILKKKGLSTEYTVLVLCAIHLSFCLLYLAVAQSI